MHDPRPHSSPCEAAPVLLGKLVLLVALFGGAWACAVFRGDPVGVQEWGLDRGPVIPHDSFPADCTLCHVGDDWSEIRADFEFDHEAETGVALLGAHADAGCLRCHNDRGPAGAFAARGCAGCHEDVHRGKLGLNCQDCHGEEDWSPREAIALHDRTGFSLVGAHAAAACWRCHLDAPAGQFSGTDTQCHNCHQDDLARADSPDHQAQGWVTDCDRCHIPTTWSGGGFNHGSFPLVGVHRNTDCVECHIGGVFAGTPRECADCHLADYQATTNPDHAAAGFPISCEECHSATGWSPASFLHDGWRLTGSHRLEECSACHGGGVFAGTPDQCVDCHAADYQGAGDPDHVASGFPTSCDECHNTTAWEPANFDHGLWPLSGAHAVADCLDCHEGGLFAGTPDQCEDCHFGEYRATTDPHHGPAGFGTQCDDCHDTTSWEGASFAHTAWRLTGAHIGASCSQCHQSAVYAGLGGACVDCHFSDYQTANDPDHVSAGFPTDCESCHSTTSWEGATFDHAFPIDSGNHSHLDCTDCHLRPGNIGAFSCTHCHEHSEAEMADDHDEVSRYMWLSSACYSCHPDGDN